jgi:hypothetical protein
VELEVWRVEMKAWMVSEDDFEAKSPTMAVGESRLVFFGIASHSHATTILKIVTTALRDEIGLQASPSNFRRNSERDKCSQLDVAVHQERHGRIHARASCHVQKLPGPRIERRNEDGCSSLCIDLSAPEFIMLASALGGSVEDTQSLYLQASVF